MKKLESLVHISTAYSHCGEKILEERAYSCPISPEKVMTLVDILNDEILTAITPKLLHDQPNTYAFTKSLGEDLIYRSNLPAGVARPSIGIYNLQLIIKFTIINDNIIICQYFYYSCCFVERTSAWLDRKFKWTNWFNDWWC